MIDRSLFNRVEDLDPVHTGVYLVDRGEAVGIWYRYFDAEQVRWGRCEFDLDDATKGGLTTSSLGWLPWRGPVAVSTKQSQKVEYAEPQADKPVVMAEQVTTRKKEKPVKVKSPKKTRRVRVSFPDGTIIYREDRQKWIAWYAGRQEAARPTIEGCQKFLMKKYKLQGNVIQKD